MSLRLDLGDLDKNGQVGDWCFVEPNEHHGLLLFLRYPISNEEWHKWYDFEPNEDYPNRGDLVSLPLSGQGHPVWQWDGNREAPTLSPSILVRDGDGNGGYKERWHGFLRSGKLETV